MISEHADIRIQLEGQLEIVERAVTRWHAAVEGLSRAEWGSDERWLSLTEPDRTFDEAFTAVSSTDSPDLTELLTTLEAAGTRARTLAAEHLRLLGHPVPDGSARDVLAELKAVTPLYETEWTTRAKPNPYFTAVAALISTVFCTLGFIGWLGAAITDTSAMILGVCAAFSMVAPLLVRRQVARLVITRRAIRSFLSGFEIDVLRTEVARVELTHGSRQDAELRVVKIGGSEAITLHIDRPNPGLPETLERLGIAVIER